MMTINQLTLQGSPYEMGFQHGSQYKKEIRKFADQRVALSGSKEWTGRELNRTEIIALAEACLPAHQAYAPSLMKELQGMADATELSLAKLIIVNGYTDFIDLVYNAAEPILPATRADDDCTAFLAPNEATDGKGAMYGQTWDMNVEAMPYTLLLRICPDDAPEALLFTTVGCIGMIGMNAAGICVGINNLMGGDGQIGVMWNFAIRKILMQENIEDALACLTEVTLAGAHNFLLLDKEGRGYNVEATSTQSCITKLENHPIAHSNHCLAPNTVAVERERPPSSRESTINRINRAQQLLNKRPITPESLMALTRDQPTICVSPNPPFFTASCGAAIMRPATGEFWAVQGLPAENEYQKFAI